MQIEVWSDFACPFCYIGKRRLEAGLEQFEHKNHVDVVYRSFELALDADVHIPHDVHDMLAQKYGMTREKAVEMNANLTEQAAQVGLDFRFDTLVLTNTFDAHRLSHFGGHYGKRSEVTELLLRAYFTDSKHLGDHATLLDIAEEAGLDREEAAEALRSGRFADAVRAEEQEANQLGVRGVPFYVINRKYAVSGAQPPEVFLQALQQAWEDANPIQLVNTGGSAAGVCTDDGCAIDGEPSRD
ncbi:DSBA oxidoreductase [Paenibacillus curdlanolyticus YK9]|uniref:DSBA oxidoreductase n=1 Tax=Paenibacillus curdlanolyticus YK9 TaxID=717606 RepID=E0IG60_9BACL|nr:DsbA family oxidoreductase [Paenibacillus curdlanolyticus]EFM08640.1 DSBA oxidoreductase [Paenibacillus curdlanolyticus YK9]